MEVFVRPIDRDGGRNFQVQVLFFSPERGAADFGLRRILSPFWVRRRTCCSKSFPYFQAVADVHPPQVILQPRLLLFQRIPAFTCPWLNPAAVALPTWAPGHLLQWVLAEEWRQMY